MFCWQYHSSSSSFHFSWTRNQPSPTARDALDVSASLFDLRPVAPRSPPRPLPFFKSRALRVKLCCRRHPDCPLSLPTPQKRPTPIPATHVTDVTLNASGVRVRALLEIVYSFIGPFCTFLIIPFGLDPFPLPPYSLVAYMYIPSAPRPWARHRTIEL